MNRRWTASVAAVVAALVGVAAAAAARPPAPLAAAQERTAQARSLHLTMAVTTRIGGETIRYTAKGVERLKAHQASLVMDMSKLAPQLGTMDVLAVGSRYYVHYTLLDRLHAQRPEIKPWIVENSVASVGFDPWSFTGSHGSIAAASHYRLLGRKNGLSRYGASLDLRAALAANPNLKQVFNRLAAAAPGLLQRPVPVEFDVGADGYLHRVTEHLTLPIGSLSLTMTVAIGMSAFNVDPGEIVAPAADQVMTLAAFKRLTATTP